MRGYKPAWAAAQCGLCDACYESCPDQQPVCDDGGYPPPECSTDSHCTTAYPNTEGVVCSDGYCGVT